VFFVIFVVILTDDFSQNIDQQNKKPQNDAGVTSIRLRRILRFKGTGGRLAAVC
jgi:hypothetical protein